MSECYWKQPEKKPKVRPDFQGRIYKTPAEKRELASKLERDDPEMLEVIKAFSEGFGILESVGYGK